MALDVVMYNVGSLSIEASTLIFDPYKLAATGLPGQVLFRALVIPATARKTFMI